MWLQVTVKQHDGKDDDEGVRIERPKECGADYRLYTVSAQQLIRVRIKNLSATPLSFQPVYVNDKGAESPEEFTAPLKQGEVRMHVCVCCWVWASRRGVSGCRLWRVGVCTRACVC